ncbi:MAG: carboxypeptidase-like regulatory domain-containing protein, partial [Bacteroidales bacterium]|nr:carboxypeptidase-like regulatory domain-containing protein [Bacteroidales bacterium]
MKKIVRMIFAAAFAGIICFNAYAQSLYNVQVENRPLSMVLAAITAQCEYKFVYNNDFIDVSRNVTVSASSDSFSELLDAVFTPLGIRYTLSGRQIALSVPEPEPEKKGDVKKNVRTVTGTVTDRTGDPLAGAVVYVDGTSTGAYCDMYGRYTIEVPDKPTTELTFDFVGMKQGRAVIGTRTVVDMVLEDTIRMLEQSVVT